MKLRPISLDQLRSVRDGSGHSIFGPSGSSMWLRCAGSLIPNLLAPNLGNEDTAYGTVAHSLMEEWGKTGVRPDHLIGTSVSVDDDYWGHLIWIDEEMLSHCETSMDWVSPVEGERHWEVRVDFSRITPIPNQKGTADLIVVQADKRRLVVVDWKFGKGVHVSAEYNTQLMLYALGALWEMEERLGIRFEEIEIRIAQPRRDNFDVWVTDRDTLMEFTGFAKARMALAWSYDAPRVAGVKQCLFCNVKGDCAAYAKINVELTEGVFDDLEAAHPVSAEAMLDFKARLDADDFSVEMIDAGTLTTEQLAKILPFRSAADKFWNRINIELMKRHQHGENLMDLGWKIVESRSRRAFKNPREAVFELEMMGVPRDELISEEVVSPAQAEVLLRKAGQRAKDIPNLLQGLTIKPRGKPTLAPLSDRREVMGDLTEGVFDNLESETTETEDY